MAKGKSKTKIVNSYVKRGKIPGTFRKGLSSSRKRGGKK